MDIHYTPSALATSLVQATSEVRPKLVADLAAGNGNLLLAAEQVWPNARFVATDIDPRAVRRLGRLRPSWTVGRCDLRSVPSRRSCLALKNMRKSACLLLLNPPFSCRGGTRFPVPTSSGPISRAPRRRDESGEGIHLTTADVRFHVSPRFGDPDLRHPADGLLGDPNQTFVGVTVPGSKTNPSADEDDVRQLVGGCAAALRRLHAATKPAPANSVVGLGVHQITRRFSAACAAAGLEGRRMPHSGRVGLAVELAARGATTRDVQLAGGWKNPGMVARYAARVDAGAGAVGRFMREPAGGKPDS